jgi:RNA polymerase sigma factor for flagellar operon FliA
VTRRLLDAYRHSRAAALRDEIVQAHLGLVKHVAARIAGRLPRHLDVNDLVSAGLLGLMAAIEEFDPGRGVEFPRYAALRIRGAILDELRRLDWIPRGVRRRIRDAERAIESLCQRLDRQPTDEEVARELGVGVEAYHQILAEGVTLVSLDSTGSHDPDGPTLLDTMEDAGSAWPLETVLEKERSAILARLIDELPERERQVLALYYVEDLTMQAVGEVLSVTESRVSQIHSSAVLRLRVALRRQRGGGAELALPRAGAAARRGQTP